MKIITIPQEDKAGLPDSTISSVKSECSESQTKPIVTISGQFIKTRRIFIFWPQLL